MHRGDLPPSSSKLGRPAFPKSSVTGKTSQLAANSTAVSRLSNRSSGLKMNNSGSQAELTTGSMRAHQMHQSNSVQQIPVKTGSSSQSRSHIRAQGQFTAKIFR